MSKTTASDRKTLIRLASTLPKGSEERKAILAGLKVARTNWKVVSLSPSTLAKATAVNWWYMMKSNMFGEYTAIRVPSEPDMWALTRGERFDPRKFRNVSSAELLRLWKKVGGWVPRDQGGTPHDPSGEIPSHEALHATGDGEARISMDPLPEYRQWRNILAGLEKTASDGQEFADLLSKKWRKVKWDERRNQGSASLGHFKISWFESGNDTAVIVNIDSMDRLKGSPENVMDALEYLNKTWMKV